MLGFTVKASAGVIPPPADTSPGCGAPWGGNIFIRGGATTAAAAIMDVATAAFFVVVSLSEICLKSLENLFYQFEKLMIYLWSIC